MTTTNLSSSVEEEFDSRCRFNVKFRKNGEVDMNSLPTEPPEVYALNWYLGLEKEQQRKLRGYSEFKIAVRILKNKRGYDSIVTRVLMTIPIKERAMYLK